MIVRSKGVSISGEIVQLWECGMMKETMIVMAFASEGHLVANVKVTGGGRLWGRRR